MKMAEVSTVAGMIDHTLLRADATIREVEQLCRDAVAYGYHSVCVNPFFVPLAKELLTASPVKLTTVIGFPLGMGLTEVKVFEAIEAALGGCEELDIVMNIGMAKSGEWSAVRKDISDIFAATADRLHKVIIETCFLSRDEKITAAEMAAGAGADFVKTSTGFGPQGASVEDIRLIKQVVGDRCGIKAAGGIRTLSQVKELIGAGATRIGTSSGREILGELTRVSS